MRMDCCKGRSTISDGVGGTIEDNRASGVPKSKMSVAE